jgi:hypothetical protein
VLLAAACLSSAIRGPSAPGWRSRAPAKKKKKKAPPKPPPPPVAQTLRSYTGPNSTRLVLDLSRTTAFHVESDSGRKTFSVEVPGGLESPGFGKPVLDDGACTASTPRRRPQGFRLTVHLVEWNPPRVFGLDGDAGQAARVVVDVVGRARPSATRRSAPASTG